MHNAIVKFNVYQKTMQPREQDLPRGLPAGTFLLPFPTSEHNVNAHQQMHLINRT